MNFDLLDTKELAVYLRVKPGTIRCWVCQGSIPYIKLQPGERGAVRFDRAEINRWIKGSLRRERRVTKRQGREEALALS
jgi:excisionase family DNA binding protein